MEKEFIIDHNEQIRINLEKRLGELHGMKIDTQQEIDRLEKDLETTNHTIQVIEIEELEIKQKLGELDLSHPSEN